MPHVSVVIPTKNEEKLLPRLLQSIKSQTLHDVEIIVADAASTDRTCEIAEGYGALVVKGGMPGPGRNAGARHAKADIIAFFDADVALPSAKFLADCLHEMRHKRIDVATCKVRPLSRKPIDRALHEAYNAYVIATEKVRPHAPGFCILVRREVHEAIGGFDESVVFAEDHEYVQRADKEGYRFGVLRTHPIAASVRRIEKDGRLAIALKYIYCELKMLTEGAIKDLPFQYKMGGDDAAGGPDACAVDALRDEASTRKG